MTAHTHEFTVGDFRCAVVTDGIRQLPPEKVAELLRVTVEDVHTAGTTTDTENCFNCLLVQTGEHVLLADTGMGIGNGSGGDLLDSLDAAGVKPEDVTTVFISHCHGDHVLGLLNPDGSRTFPDAQVVMNQAEWDGWHSDAMKARMGDNWAIQMKPVLAIQDRLTLIQPGEAIIPGVTAVPTYGHTPGHCALMVESNGERLLDMVDALHIPVQMAHPEWSIRFDSDPETAALTRHEILGLAADEGVLTLLFHFPFPGLGHVRRTGDVFAWEPLS